MASRKQLILSLLAATAAAQTSSTCNPLKGCMPKNPACPSTFNTNFAGQSKLPAGWIKKDYSGGDLDFTNDGIGIVFNKQGDAPQINTNCYFFFGSVEAKFKVAQSPGLISSLVVMSSDLDEWDFVSWTGGRCVLLLTKT